MRSHINGLICNENDCLKVARVLGTPGELVRPVAVINRRRLHTVVDARAAHVAPTTDAPVTHPIIGWQHKVASLVLRFAYNAKDRQQLLGR